DNPTGVGAPCGNGTGACTLGSMVCDSVAKKLVCQGGTKGGPETCNGIDDDCDGTVDNNLTDVGGDCDVPNALPAPTGTCAVISSPCKKGTLVCNNGIPKCQGSTTSAPGATDGCCADSNCDGTLGPQPDTTSDIHNCGGCGIDCALNNPAG